MHCSLCERNLPWPGPWSLLWHDGRLWAICPECQRHRNTARLYEQLEALHPVDHTTTGS